MLSKVALSVTIRLCDTIRSLLWRVRHLNCIVIEGQWVALLQQVEPLITWVQCESVI